MDVRTSAHIIREARNELLSRGNGGARFAANTGRPETPATKITWSHSRRKRNSSAQNSMTVSELFPNELEPLPPIGANNRPLSSVVTSTTCDGVQNKLKNENYKEYQYFGRTIQQSHKNSLPSLVRIDASNPHGLTVDSAYSSRPSSGDSCDLERLPSSISAPINQLLIYVRDSTEQGILKLAEVSETLNFACQTTKRDQKQLSQKIIVQILLSDWKNQPTPTIAGSLAMLTICLNSGIADHRLDTLYDLVTTLKLDEIDEVNNNRILRNLIDTMLSQLDQSLNHKDFDRFDTLLAIATFLSESVTIRSCMQKRRTVRCLGSCLRLCTSSEFHLASHGFIFVEITALFLSLFRDSCDLNDIIQSKLIASLVLLLKNYYNYSELAFNIVRIFSRLSMYSELCDEILSFDPEIFSVATACLTLHSKSSDFLVRLFFVLGNLVTHSEKAQWHLYKQPFFMDALRAILHDILNNSDGDNNCDLLVKLIRLLANLLVHVAVGSSMCSDIDLTHLLLQVLVLPYGNEELHLNVLVAIHNLSYYGTMQPLFNAHLDVAQALHPVLLGFNFRLVIEVCNILGNLSQHQQVQQWLVERKVHTMMLDLLGSSDPELAGAAAGILINLTRNTDILHLLLTQSLGKRVIQMLNRQRENRNWHLCSLGCKIFWNIAMMPELMVSEFSELEVFLLETTNDESSARHWSSTETVFDWWEDEYCPLATELLEKINSRI